MFKSLFQFFLVLLIVTACFKSSERDNVIRFPLNGNVPSIDPVESFDTISGHVVYQMYEPLYEYHYLKRPSVVQPLLAEDMPEINKERTKYTIKIKKGVRYHNDPVFKGKPRFVTAQDLVTQIKRIAFKGSDSNGWFLFDNKIIGINNFRETVGSDFEKFLTNEIEGVKALDEHTLEIQLIKPYPQFLYVMTLSFMSPIPMEAVKAYKNSLNGRSVGTGPFYLEDWAPNKKVTLKAFNHYREETYPNIGDRVSHSLGVLEDAGKRIPFIDGIEFLVVDEAEKQWEMFLKEEIDFVTQIPNEKFNQIIDESGNLVSELQNKGISVQKVPSKTFWWISFNMNHPILGKHQKLREAIAYAIDWDSFIKKFTNNTGQRANSIYPPGIPGYNPSKSLPFNFDPQKSRDLLAEAGFPEGKGLPAFSYVARRSNTTELQKGNFIKEHLEEIGLKIKVEHHPWPEFLARARNGEHEIWQDGWRLDYFDAENVLSILSNKNFPPGPNKTFYSSDEFEKLFEKIIYLEDGEEKHQLMSQIENIVLKDVPWIMQFYERIYVVHHNYLKNFRYSDRVVNFFKFIRKK